MTGFGKFLVGAAVTSLLAWGSVAISGDKMIDGIEGDAKTAFAGMSLPGTSAADVAMQRDPLARFALVSGTYDDATKDSIRDTLLAVPGVSKVLFTADRGSDGAGDGADAAGAGAGAGAAAPADEAAVAECQTGVDSIMDGKSINFASGSANISADSNQLLDSLADSIKACPGMTVAIGGHTDATGSDAVNQPLSQARADAVASALTERGVGADAITATGYGSSQPKVEGANSAANAANRRIEFTLSAANAATAEGE